MAVHPKQGVDPTSKHLQPTCPVFEVEHLTKRYPGPPPVLANHDVSLSIKAGAIWGIFGPNGAGKTTLVRQMLGLLKPTAGQVLLFGADVNRNPEIIPLEVGYLPQSGHALWDLTPDEALYYTGRLRGLGQRAARAEAQSLIERWQLVPFRDQVVRRLSGGQQRLVGLASILMGSPRVLVLDEPTTHMDPAYRRLVWDHLLQLNQEDRVTIVLVTHSLLEAETIISDMAIMNQGCLVVQGAPAQLRAGLGEQVHLDLTWHTVTPQIEQLMLDFGPQAQHTDQFRWRLTLDKGDADAAIARLLQHVSVQELVDLRLHGIGLEDYYLAITSDNGAWGGEP